VALKSPIPIKKTPRYVEKHFSITLCLLWGQYADACKQPGEHHFKCRCSRTDPRNDKIIKPPAIHTLSLSLSFSLSQPDAYTSSVRQIEGVT
jgi:hypothetical protein